MSEKEKLAQFRVDDFLRKIADATLSGDKGHLCTLSLGERAVLMTLANHVRNGSDCYPSQQYLAAYLGIAIKTIKRILQTLKKKKLIQSFKKPSNNKRYKTSRHNYYSLSLPVDNCVIGGVYDPIHTVIGVVDDPCHIGDRGQIGYVIGVVDDPLIEHSNKTIKNKERESVKAHPLPDDFVPSKKTIKMAQDGGLTEEEANYELEKFEAHYKANGAIRVNWDAEATKWYLRGIEHKRKGKNGYGKKAEVIRSTVPDYTPPVIGDRGDPNVAARALGDILGNLGLRQGAKPNGLGNTRPGKGK
jgi:DNA-binding MarR family transcriptional regulator